MPRDRREEKRIDDVLGRSDLARSRGDTDSAISLRREVVARARALEGDRPAEAVAALDESPTTIRTISPWLGC